MKLSLLYQKNIDVPILLYQIPEIYQRSGKAIHIPLNYFETFPERNIWAPTSARHHVRRVGWNLTTARSASTALPLPISLPTSKCMSR